ncbi:MAG TPA: hypothetical protein VH062_33300 [Polyangiaceae bacterium]|nr:hypothetical protein [Polyangiaceae bacterium]
MERSVVEIANGSPLLVADDVDGRVTIDPGERERHGKHQSWIAPHFRTLDESVGCTLPDSQTRHERDAARCTRVEHGTEQHLILSARSFLALSTLLFVICAVLFVAAAKPLAVRALFGIVIVLGVRVDAGCFVEPLTPRNFTEARSPTRAPRMSGNAVDLDGIEPKHTAGVPPWVQYSALHAPNRGDRLAEALRDLAPREHAVRLAEDEGLSIRVSTLPGHAGRVGRCLVHVEQQEATDHVSMRLARRMVRRFSRPHGMSFSLRGFGREPIIDRKSLDVAVLERTIVRQQDRAVLERCARDDQIEVALRSATCRKARTDLCVSLDYCLGHGQDGQHPSNASDGSEILDGARRAVCTVENFCERKEGNPHFLGWERVGS